MTGIECLVKHAQPCFCSEEGGTSELDEQIRQQETCVNVVRHQIVKTLRKGDIALSSDVLALLHCEERETERFHELLRKLRPASCPACEFIAGHAVGCPEVER